MVNQCLSDSELVNYWSIMANYPWFWCSPHFPLSQEQSFRVGKPVRFSTPLLTAWMIILRGNCLAKSLRTPDNQGLLSAEAASWMPCGWWSKTFLWTPWGPGWTVVAVAMPRTFESLSAGQSPWLVTVSPTVRRAVYHGYLAGKGLHIQVMSRRSEQACFFFLRTMITGVVFFNHGSQLLNSYRNQLVNIQQFHIPISSFAA